MACSFLFSNPKTYMYWWTCIPVLPASADTLEYKVLKRIWADHTINCLSNISGAWKLSSSRGGFYVEKSEDHIVPALFHIFALFPEFAWVGPLLDLWDIEHGNISRARWSFSWEQKRDRASRPDICDIVLSYEDELGPGILIIEAKRPGGSFRKKDLNGGRNYLNLPSVRPFTRKKCVFVLDGADVSTATTLLPAGTAVASWQSLGRLQIELMSELSLPNDLRRFIGACIARHYECFGMALGLHSTDKLDAIEFTGTEDRYRQIFDMGLSSSVERFLLGAEVSFCARAGRLPDPPYPWLSREPSFVEIVERARRKVGQQTTKDREIPLWRLS